MAAAATPAATAARNQDFGSIQGDHRCTAATAATAAISVAGLAIASAAPATILTVARTMIRSPRISAGRTAVGRTATADLTISSGVVGRVSQGPTATIITANTAESSALALATCPRIAKHDGHRGSACRGEHRIGERDPSTYATGS